MKLKLALVQMDTRLGVMSANLEKHLDYIKKAKGADLVIFPELSLTGYILQDLVPTVVSRPTSHDPTFKTLLQASKDTDLLVGFVEEDDRHRYFNSAAYLSKGKVVHIHRKVYLPTYSMFDEGRFWAWGDSVRAFDTRFGRAGVLICEDFWHASNPYLLWMDGADLFYFISVSPSRGLTTDENFDSAAFVEHVGQAYASLFTSFVAQTNRVGYEDGINFWGGASVYDPNGEQIAKGLYHEESLTLAELDLDELERARKRLPLLRDERSALVQRELNRILQQRGRTF